MPDLSFFAIQALGLVPSILCFTSLQSGSRSRILRLQMVCCVMWAGHYGLLGAYTAVLTNAVGLFRAILCYHNDRPWAKHKGWVVLLLGLYLGSALLTWDGFYCLLPCFSMCCTTLALWTHNMARTRLLFLVNSPPMLALPCTALTCVSRKPPPPTDSLCQSAPVGPRRGRLWLYAEKKDPADCSAGSFAVSNGPCPKAKKPSISDACRT